MYVCLHVYTFLSFIFQKTRKQIIINNNDNYSTTFTLTPDNADTIPDNDVHIIVQEGAAEILGLQHPMISLPQHWQSLSNYISLRRIEMLQVWRM